MAAPARAQPHLLPGVSEDGLKWRSADARRVADDLGLQAFRITLPWSGQTELVPFDRAPLAGAVAAAAGKRLILSVVDDLMSRGFSAVEAYPEPGARPDTTSAATPAFWQGCGFEIAVADERFPVVRREL